MKISVITCTYNSEKYIGNNIKSVLSQTYKDIEHIIVDGYSSDSTLKILDEYKNQNTDVVKVIQSKPLGISNAMNLGIKNASGDFLIILHSDDSFFDINVLRDAKDFVDKNSKFDWFYGKILVLNEGKEIGYWPIKKIWHTNSNNFFGKYILKYYNYVPHQAVFIRKSIFDKYGLFDEEIVSGMDQEYWLRIKNSTKWTYWDRVVSFFTLRQDSQTGNQKNREINCKNYKNVQKKYMNKVEIYIAYLIDFLFKILRK